MYVGGLISFASTVIFFWNSGCVIADFLVKGTTINPQRYIETLTALKRRI
jgi:hypothetical protein